MASTIDIDRPVHTSTGQLLGRLFRESMRGYGGWFLAALVCMGLMAGATALSAWLMEPVVNDIFVNRNEAMLMPVGLAVFAVLMATVPTNQPFHHGALTCKLQVVVNTCKAWV